MKNITSRWNPQKLGILQLISGAVMISFAAVFVRLTSVGPTTSALYRMLFGGIMLMIIVLLTGKSLWAGLPAFGLMLACGFFFTIDLAVWHRSIIYIGPGLATILANFQVFFLATFGILVYKEKPTLKYLISIPLALSGLFLFVGPDWADLGGDYKLGVLFGLITALAYSSYLLALRKLRSIAGSLSPLSVIAVISLVTSALLALLLLLEGGSFVIPDTKNLMLLIGYGLAAQVLGWVLISRGITRIDASRAGLILLLQPTLAFIWDIIFFHRPAGALDLSGAVITISAIYLGSMKK